MDGNIRHKEQKTTKQNRRYNKKHLAQGWRFDNKLQGNTREAEKLKPKDAIYTT